MAGLEFVRTYLDDLLILSKNSFAEHLQQLEAILKRLADAGLKVHTEKVRFVQTG